MAGNERHPNLAASLEVLLTANAILHDAKNMLARVEAIAARQETILAEMKAIQALNCDLLKANSVAITERSIHQNLRLAEAKAKRSERFYKGHPGVPADVLEGKVQ